MITREQILEHALRVILGHDRNSPMYGTDACSLCSEHRELAQAALPFRPDSKIGPNLVQMTDKSS